MTEYKVSPEEIGPSLDIKDGKIRDYLTNSYIRHIPEEEVRQIMLRRLVEEYGYPKELIATNFNIQKGSKRIGPTDIVTFRNKTHSFDNIYIIVETKKKNRRDGIDQLKSYLSPTKAEFGVWFNGKEISFIQNTNKPPYFREIPDIPKFGETLDEIGLYKKKDLKPATELKTIFETCHNYIYANEGYLKEKVFNEVLKMIFIKMVDEKSPEPKCEFRITDKEFEELEAGKSNAFWGRIIKLFDRVKEQYADVFSGERINLKPLTAAFVVSQLQKYSLINTPADVKGIAFQTFVYAHQRGERGEFFTPYPIVELAVKILNPDNGEKFIDPTCGSGGFLVRGMNWVKEKFEKNRPDLSPDKVREYVKDYAHTYIKGIDINPDLARVSKMYMILYDDGHTGIFSANSLEPFKQINEVAKDTRAGLIKPKGFKILLTNPPFGSKGKVTDKRILEEFELGHKCKKNKDNNKWEKTSNLMDGQVPDILFIERCIQLLDNYGRMAIVLPDGDLTNSSLGYVRQFIRDNTRIMAVVSLPQETFVPHGAGVKASVLFLQKLPKKELDALKGKDYPIFMAICEKIGYDIRGRTVYKRDERGEVIKDKQGNPIVDTDIPEIIEAFDKFKKNNRLGF